MKIFCKNLSSLIVSLISLLYFSCTNEIYKNTNYELDKNLTQNVYTDSIEINDGPYLFINENNIIRKEIINGDVKTSTLGLDSEITLFSSEPAIFENIEKIVALSDIHGQFNLSIEILKNNKVIDNNLDWDFGKGHLVIVGDIFDRGNQVTEALWYFYNLEKQAEEIGGKVHYLLGNHEFMIFHNDLRYLHKKYEIASSILEIPFSKLFGPQTILGRWLRSKHTIIKINDILFVHGGISEDFISDGFDLNQINQLLRESIDRDKDEMELSSFYSKYYQSKGPFWYRGYFEDNLTNNDIEKLLDKLNVNHIIVGHTSQQNVLKLFDGKIYAVDSSIKNGKYGELLLIDDGSFVRGTMRGEKIQF